MNIFRTIIWSYSNSWKNNTYSKKLFILLIIALTSPFLYANIPTEVDSTQSYFFSKNLPVYYSNACVSFPDNCAPLWNLERMTRRNGRAYSFGSPLSFGYPFFNQGKGVHLYVLDSGLNTTHAEFTDTTLGASYSPFPGVPIYEDTRGHGTALASTMVGKNVGIAPKATLHVVKRSHNQADGRRLSVDTFGLIELIEWVIDQKLNLHPSEPAVINMSFSSPLSRLSQEEINAFNDVIFRAHDAGIVLVTGAGNREGNACDYYPGHLGGAGGPVIVSANSAPTDYLFEYINNGVCVDMVVPGVEIYVASHEDNNSYLSVSGGSLTGPHVAGVAALILSHEPHLTPDQLKARLIAYSTKNVISCSPNDPRGAACFDGAANALLYIPQGNYLQSGKVTISATVNREDDIEVFFERPFDEKPVVVMGPPSYNDADPAAIRITEVSNTGFKFRLQEWDYLDGQHSGETISYFAAKPGQHVVGNMKIDAREVSVNNEWQSFGFGGYFGSTKPVVFHQVASNRGVDVIATRIHNLNPDGFELRLQEQEYYEREGRGKHRDERVNIIAMSPGELVIPGNQRLIVGSYENLAGHDFQRLSFPGLDISAFLAHMQTTRGDNVATLRMLQEGQSTVYIKADEEQSFDDEKRHRRETVGFAIIGSNI